MEEHPLHARAHPGLLLHAHTRLLHSSQHEMTKGNPANLRTSPSVVNIDRGLLWFRFVFKVLETEAGASQQPGKHSTIKLCLCLSFYLFS